MSMDKLNLDLFFSVIILISLTRNKKTSIRGLKRNKNIYR